ncbi:hypothetical protein CHS0354_006884 [Potamilus streckersoni]|uniref:FecR protein domain-containing protein n=1 Tax=Potamilus streckersoni TaxID=2493646 RepID=A0AAE0TFP3_9BIVA|nr:hypothetical protein CHS0354_006884 [Potamilus streckersoni]
MKRLLPLLSTVLFAGYFFYAVCTAQEQSYGNLILLKGNAEVLRIKDRLPVSAEKGVFVLRQKDIVYMSPGSTGQLTLPEHPGRLVIDELSAFAVQPWRSDKLTGNITVYRGTYRVEGDVRGTFALSVKQLYIVSSAGGVYTVYSDTYDDVMTATFTGNTDIILKTKTIRLQQQRHLSVLYGNLVEGPERVRLPEIIRVSVNSDSSIFFVKNQSPSEKNPFLGEFSRISKNSARLTPTNHTQICQSARSRKCRRLKIVRQERQETDVLWQQERDRSVISVFDRPAR